jgi:dTDP-4-dehydrorhamnose reductase
MENNDNSLVLVTGSEGLVGSRFVEISKHGNRLHSPKMVELDILNRVELQAVIGSFDFCSIVNFAAFTDVNSAENERNNKNGLAWKINVEGVRNLAEAVAPFKDKIQLIHISTDMVFPGSSKNKGPYGEDRLPEENPDFVTWYGYTKAQGEKVLKDILGENSTILRIIYPVRAKFENKLDYLRKPLELFDQGKLYPVFEDQQISFSFIDDVCMALDKMIELKARGIYHACSSDLTTPFELISYMLEKVRGVKGSVKGIKIDDFIKDTKQKSYRYPKYGGLLVSNTEKTLGLNFKSCKEVVDELVEQGLGKK